MSTTAVNCKHLGYFSQLDGLFVVIITFIWQCLWFMMVFIKNESESFIGEQAVQYWTLPDCLIQSSYTEHWSQFLFPRQK